MYCNNCSKENAKLRCSKCKLVYYCSNECQKQDWKKHKLICNNNPENENNLTKRMAGFISKGKLYENDAKNTNINKFNKIKEDIRKKIGGLENGVYQNLLNNEYFINYVYPGVDISHSNVPKSLLELIEIPSYKVILLEEMDKIQKEADDIIDKTKKKCESSSGVLPTDVEVKLRSEAFYDSFAKRAVRLAKDSFTFVQKNLSENDSNVADPKLPQANYNQINDDVEKSLFNCNYTIINNYIGRSLNMLVMKDCKRIYKSYSVLSEDNSKSNFMWIEISMIQNKYPSLYKLCNHLKALPYEMNKKYNYKLCDNLPYTFMLSVNHKIGQFTPPRLDCGTESNNNGLKFSCTYIINNDINDLKNSCQELIYINEDKKIEIDRNIDTLIIWKSDSYLEGITKYTNDIAGELYTLNFFIYGRL